MYSTFGQSASITELYGDKDGFGFNDTTGLVNSQGNPADSNGNGILEPGEFLPDLNVGGGINPAGDDFFDNREGDPIDTDVGVIFSDVFSVSFSFALPASQLITAATFRIVIGDASLQDEALHVISLDGFSTGVTIEPRGIVTDGLITETVVDIDPSLFSEFMDGEAVFSISYDRSPDDVAVDFAELTIRTTVAEPTAIALMSLGLAGIGYHRRKRATH